MMFMLIATARAWDVPVKPQPVEPVQVVGPVGFGWTGAPHLVALGVVNDSDAAVALAWTTSAWVTADGASLPVDLLDVSGSALAAPHTRSAAAARIPDALDGSDRFALDVAYVGPAGPARTREEFAMVPDCARGRDEAGAPKRAGSAVVGVGGLLTLIGASYMLGDLTSGHPKLAAAQGVVAAGFAGATVGIALPLFAAGRSRVDELRAVCPE